MSFFRRDDGEWGHRPWWKVAINTVLRWFQPSPRKWVIATICDDSTSPPTVVGYTFRRIHHGPP